MQAKKAATKSELRENVLHNDARVVPIAPLLLMIIKREFEEEISGSCRKTAAKGLTIFAVPTMSQAAVNRTLHSGQNSDVNYSQGCHECLL